MKISTSYLKGWLKTPETFTSKKNYNSLNISVLVAIRNEELNLDACLKSLINQNYNSNNFEIIVIDDFSEDKSTEITLFYKKIKLLKLENYIDANFKSFGNKKRAISLGVKHAKHDIIITTDGDCLYPENWLKSMAEAYLRTHSKMITAPVLFYQKKGLLSLFLELDLISLIGITCADIKNRNPSMSNGANLLFEKKCFTEVNGYQGNEHIPSGDDVFLMQKFNARYENSISFLKNKDAIVYTHMPNTFKVFLNQRIRWSSKSVAYADAKTKQSLLINYLFYVIILSNILTILIGNYLIFSVGCIMLLIKIIIDKIFFSNLLHFFNRQTIVKSLIQIEILHLIYISLLGFFSIYGKYSWKNRTNNY